MANITKQGGFCRYTEIDINEIQNREIVGRGSFGTVYKALWQNQDVAVKEFDLEVDKKSINTEIKQLSRVTHPNIIVLYGVSRVSNRICLVMEYAEEGSLYNFLHSKPLRYYSAAHAMSWARQCAEGVAYLHAMKPNTLIHRDLKPPNLLLMNKGRTLKICDFGTVVDKSTLMTNNRGSAAWMAPEVFAGPAYTEKCDLFSWGIILWEILAREQPFKEMGIIYSILWRVYKGQRPPLIEGCPKPIEKLMTSCWDPEPANRPTMENVVKTMRALCEFFPGADEPLNCSPQPLNYCDDGIIEDDVQTIDSNQYGFNPFSNDSLITPTNSAELFYTTQQQQQPHGLEIYANENENEQKLEQNQWQNNNVNSNEWNSVSTVYNNGNRGYLPANLNHKRNDEIRNEILKFQRKQIQPLSIDVDPNAWELNREEYQNHLRNIPKSEGKERLTVTETKPVDSDSADEDDINDETTDSSLHLMLDPELQPESPDPNSRLSQEIFREHQKLAKEYLRVDTELYYARDRKEKILAAMNPQERQEKLTLIKKIMEKEDLLEFYNDLKNRNQRNSNSNIINESQQQYPSQQQNNVDANSSQQEFPSSSEGPPEQTDEGWVVINSSQST